MTDDLFTVSSLSEYHYLVASKGVLNIPSDLWKVGYEWDISPFVERNTFKESNQKNSNKEIKYLSWPHAYRIFKQLHPTLNVGFIHNEYLSPALKEQIGYKDDTPVFGYYCLGYLYDPEGNTTPLTYYPFMNTSNGPLLSTDFDKNGNPNANPLRFNLNVLRALTKVIAIYTGIGLKLWTGEDLDPTIADRKIQIIDKIQERYAEYLVLLKDLPDKFIDDMEFINREGTMLTEKQLISYGKKVGRLVKELKPEEITVVE